MQTEWIRFEWIRTGGLRVERICIGGIRIGGIRLAWICVGYVWCEIRQQSSEEPCDETLVFCHPPARSEFQEAHAQSCIHGAGTGQQGSVCPIWLVRLTKTVFKYESLIALY